MDVTQNFQSISYKVHLTVLQNSATIGLIIQTLPISAITDQTVCCIAMTKSEMFAPLEQLLSLTNLFT